MARALSNAGQALLACLLACLGVLGAHAFTKPDQLQLLINFRDAMLARPQHSHWATALATWTCPTAPNNTVGGPCDPCGQQTWGNWDHVSCRGKEISYDQYEVPGDGIVSNLHITDLLIEGPVPLPEMCPFNLREFDLDGGALSGTIPTGFAQCYSRLFEIDLSFNQLTGTVPPELAAVATLAEFKVEHNRLTGTVPASFGSMPALSWLRYADNAFTGPIPETYAATAPRLLQLTLDGTENDFSGNLYMLANHRFVNMNAAGNAKMCGMVPVGARFAHGFNPYGTQLGLPCPEELAGGWTDLSEVLP